MSTPGEDARRVVALTNAQVETVRRALSLDPNRDAEVLLNGFPVPLRTWEAPTAPDGVEDVTDRHGGRWSQQIRRADLGDRAPMWRNHENGLTLSWSRLLGDYGPLSEIPDGTVVP